MSWASRLDDVLQAFGWAYEDLANVFQVSPLTAYGWGNNQPMPHDVLDWVEEAEWAIRLEAVRRAFKWTYADLARVLQVSISTGHGWCSNKQPMPASVKGWVPVWERVVQQQNQARLREFGSKLLETTVIGGGLLLTAYFLGLFSSSTGRGSSSTGRGSSGKGSGAKGKRSRSSGKGKGAKGKH